MAYVNCACDSCGTVGMCVVIQGEFDDDCVLCADCSRINEELATDFADDMDDDEDFDMGDELDIDPEFDYDSPEDDFNYDFHFNPIEQGMYDE